MQCGRCGSTSVITEVRGPHTGLFCNNCGKFIKWLSAKEVKQIDMGVGLGRTVKKNSYNRDIGSESSRRGGVRLIGTVTECCGYDLGYMCGRASYCPVCGREIMERL